MYKIIKGIFEGGVIVLALAMSTFPEKELTPELYQFKKELEKI
jgi:hypothetical protein